MSLLNIEYRSGAEPDEAVYAVLFHYRVTLTSNVGSDFLLLDEDWRQNGDAVLPRLDLPS